MRVALIAVGQGDDCEIGGSAGFEAAGYSIEAERFSAAQRRHAKQGDLIEVRVARSDESRFSEQAQIGVGGEAIGAERDSDAAGEEFAERMRRMAKRGVGAGAIYDRGLRPDRRLAGKKI